MSAEHSKHLRRLYMLENPLRALGAEAARLEREEGAPRLVRCNVGDPTGPTMLEANWAMAEYHLMRPAGTGYTDHTGEPGLRREAAKILAEIGRLPGNILNADKVFCVPGGTGGLNTALSIFNEGTQVLVTDPFYPPWDPISERNSLNLIRFSLREQDDYLLNEAILREKLNQIDPEKAVVLMYHYPHNPTGKTLTEGDAIKVGSTLNLLMKDFPNLYLVQEDLYLATVRSDLGVHTPMRYLSSEALERFMLVHSPSKEGHGQDRAALVATPSAEIAKRLRGNTAFSYLGVSTGAFVGTVTTVREIAQGIDPAPAGQNDINHRYVTAAYYQERMVALGQAFLDLEKALGVSILDHGIPEGTYYLWPKLDFLKGKAVPLGLQSDLNHADAYLGSGPQVISSTHDIMHVLSRAHGIGLLGVMSTPGDFFTENNKDFRIRLAAVDPDIGRLHEAANTIKGVIGTLMGLDLNQLGVKVRTYGELMEAFPVKPAEAGFEPAALTLPKRSPIEWVRAALRRLDDLG